ncbi:MAG TPA: hypothetical protein IAB54_04870 [Candidatus Scatomonas merdigallinarum]|nr:hypothetical protein [Candidatus Scatomonas merdigallinarum]
MEKYTACICEGGAERAILDLLLDAHKLIFEREDLIEEELLRCRNAREFERRYLKKGFSEKITVYRILDSRRENFKLSKAYEQKIDVINVITAPEIEMLIICCEGKYKEFKNSGLKPSVYCKTKLKLINVKNYEFIQTYFSDMHILINALHEYRRVSKIRKEEKTLFDLLKSSY